MVAYEFLPQNFGKVVGPVNNILSVCECSLSSWCANRWWDTSISTAIIEFV